MNLAVMAEGEDYEEQLQLVNPLEEVPAQDGELTDL